MNITTEKITLSIIKLNVVISLFFTFLYHNTLWFKLYRIVGYNDLSSLFFYISFFIFISALCFLVLSIIALLPGYKGWLTLIIVGAAAATYFVDQYGVYIDSGMITNALETDADETLDLVNLDFIFHMFFYGILPSVVLLFVKIEKDKSWLGWLSKFMMPVAGFVVCISVVYPFFQTYSSVMRNNKELRCLIVPGNFIYGIGNIAYQKIKTNDNQFYTIADDAILGKTWQERQDQKPVLVLFIVGETARAQNFSLSGYLRETNPGLSKEDIIYYTDVNSCGTATAVSLPCMFSKDGRKDFSSNKAKNSENLTDLINKVGFNVAWIDNNSGCKGVCERMPTLKMKELAECFEEKCFDVSMLNSLNDLPIKNSVVFMHQMGSHGPAYYKRSPDELKKFFPECKTNQLQDCTHEEIVNTYDNSILYTDHFVTESIKYLESVSGKFTTALVYVSDHGESLGENGLYLHGAPYMIAPEEQIHVPMLIWLSDDYKRSFHVNSDCLKHNSGNEMSHDNLFSSVLGLLDIETKDRNSALDIFDACKTNKLT